MRAELPSGTVTFVFTDVEGSTRLLDELGAEAYAQALGEHRRVVREACAALGGVEVDTQGDAFFLAFARAPAALDAAEAITQRLEGGPIRLRIGLHTGSPVVTDEGYVGADVHRAARIAAAGHGGQVLVSSATAALVGRPLTDLGEHRFKDLHAPERVFQLGEGQFPPIRSLHRSNLPVPATPFLGRETELEAVSGMLLDRGTRLVSLTGPGGTGKTRLSLQAAAEASDAFPDGVLWVPLAPLRDPTLVARSVLEAVGLSEQGGRSPIESLAAGLQGKRLLLVLDNGEHLMPALASDVAAMLDAAPELVVLVTTRERLRLESERVYAVPTLAEQDGAGLFVARARALDPSFSHTPVVDEICRRLDYLPLALELAAARTGLLSPEQLLDRLGGRLDILKGSRDRDPRQQTLRTTIAWSHELLDAEERRTYASLSVFAGGCTLESAEEVCGCDLDTVQSLLDKSLLRRRDSAHGRRLWMLETIREFAAEQLTSSGEADAMRGSHLEHYAALARAFREDGERHEYDLDRVEPERDNLRLALENALALDPDRAIELAADLGVYWSRRGHYGEGRDTLAAALAAAPDAKPLVRARALHAAGYLAQKQSALDDAERLSCEALELFRAVGDAKGTATTLVILAITSWYRGDLGEATLRLEQASDIFATIGDERGGLNVLANLAAVANATGDHRRAIEVGREIVGRSTSESARANALNNLGLAEEAAGETQQARRSFEECVTLSRVHGLAETLAYGLASLAHLLSQSEPALALRHYGESLALLMTMGDERGIAYCLEGGASILAAGGGHADAAGLLGAASAIRARTGATLSADEQAEVDAAEERSRQALAPEEFARAWDGGSALATGTAADRARQLWEGLDRLPETASDGRSLQNGP